MKKTVQYFSEDYLEWCKSLKTEQILEFLENFRSLHLYGISQSNAQEDSKNKKKSRLISMKVPVDLLEVFQMRARSLGIPYQTQIKKLMQEWLKQKD